MAEIIESIDIFFLNVNQNNWCKTVNFFMDYYPKEHVSMTASYPLPIPQDEIVRNIFKNSLFWKKKI